VGDTQTASFLASQRDKTQQKTVYKNQDAFEKMWKIVLEKTICRSHKYA
jgi:hypothetical protein